MVLFAFSSVAQQQWSRVHKINDIFQLNCCCLLLLLIIVIALCVFTNQQGSQFKVEVVHSTTVIVIVVCSTYNPVDDVKFHLNIQIYFFCVHRLIFHRYKYVLYFSSESVCICFFFVSSLSVDIIVVIHFEDAVFFSRVHSRLFQEFNGTVCS